MKSITGLTTNQVHTLADQIREGTPVSGLPPMINTREGVIITLIYLRTNRTQEDIAYTRRMSQPTVSRTISAMTTAFATVLADLVPTLDEVPTGTAYVIDGSLLPSAGPGRTGPSCTPASTTPPASTFSSWPP